MDRFIKCVAAGAAFLAASAIGLPVAFAAPEGQDATLEREAACRNRDAAACQVLIDSGNYSGTELGDLLFFSFQASPEKQRYPEPWLAAIEKHGVSDRLVPMFNATRVSTCLKTEDYSCAWTSLPRTSEVWNGIFRNQPQQAAEMLANLARGRWPDKRPGERLAALKTALDGEMSLFLADAVAVEQAIASGDQAQASGLLAEIVPDVSPVSAAGNPMMQGVANELARMLTPPISEYPCLRYAFALGPAYRAEGKKACQAMRDNASGLLRERASYVYGIAMLKFGDFGAARSGFEESLSFSPANASAGYGLGLALRGLGQRAQGDEQLKKALAADASVAQQYAGYGLLP
ncbi:hypothetical protein ABC955_04485 [Citromicrobium bathyomarinum]